MIIDREIKKYIVFSEDSILHALEKIGRNQMRVIFAVNERGILQGVMTDGDFRRWLTSQQDLNLEQSVMTAANQEFLSLPLGTSAEKIDAKLSHKIEHIPLVDEQFRLVGVASREQPILDLGGFVIDHQSPCFIIAEIGNNHNGDVELAEKLVDAAAGAGANCAKFQMRDIPTLYSSSKHGSDLGTEYTLDLLRKYQLNDDDMFRIFDYCREKELTPMCTPYDLVTLRKLEKYGMPAYKIASADLTNDDLLEAVARTGKPIICSTGMSRESEIRHAVNVLRSQGAAFILLHCNSTYPAPFKDIQLQYMERLKEIGDCFVGYSGHERGIAVSVSSVAMGAKVVEKHFTLDRDMEGRDHQISLLPAEFADMTEGIREVETAMGTPGTERTISQGELINRETLAKSLVINCDLHAGQIIESRMVEARSPGIGLPPYEKSRLIGKTAKHDFEKGDFFYLSDVEDIALGPKEFTFNHPWGLPVRFHDSQEMLRVSNPAFLEFHLSYKDLEVDPHACFDGELPVDFTVHSPELFAGDHILDLCSPDAEYRRHSITELQKVVDLTREMQKHFPKTQRPFIVTNVGGFSIHAPLSAEENEPLIERLTESLNAINSDGVEIIPQTMPPFPWHFGGQRYHNLFVDPQEIAAFCAAHNMRVCFDLSHSKLACNFFKWSFRDFIRTVGPYTAHLHIADARGLDGEGLQIGEGEIDLQSMAEELAEHAPDAWFIPEIWQGHKNKGEGFWKALRILEKYPF